MSEAQDENEAADGQSHLTAVLGVDSEMHDELKRAVAALRECARRGGAINQSKAEWFGGYAKACNDIERMVIDKAFNGEPLPELWRKSNERPECTQT